MAWQRNYFLKHFNVNLFMSLHLEMNSLRLFSVNEGPVLPVTSLSVKQKITFSCATNILSGLRSYFGANLNFYLFVFQVSDAFQQFRAIFFTFIFERSCVVITALFKIFFKSSVIIVSFINYWFADNSSYTRHCYRNFWSNWHSVFWRQLHVFFTVGSGSFIELVL